MRNVTAWKLRGPVHTLRTEHANWDDTHSNWFPPRGVSVISFRPDGQPSDEESHNADGSISRWNFQYDDNGRVLEEQWRKNDEPTFRIVHGYDADGRLAETYHVSNDGVSRLAEQHQYDETGRRTKVQFFEPARPDHPALYGVDGSAAAYPAPGAVTCTTLCDERHLPYEATFRDADGVMVMRIEILRNDAGRVVHEVARYGEESPFLHGTPNMSPDERTQFSAILSQLFAEHVHAETTYAYDERGRVIEEVRRMGSLSEARTTRMYDDDDHDDPIEMFSVDKRRGANMTESGGLQTNGEDRSHKTKY